MQEKTLSLLFLLQNSKVLLAMKKRGFGEGRWNGVGGKVEGSESLEEAMVREAQEEIGVTPKDYKKVGYLKFEEHFKGKPTIMHVHVFTAKTWLGEPTESEEMSPKWFDIRDIPYDSMWPDDPFWLPKVLAEKLVTATFKLDKSDKIISHRVTVVKELP